MSGIELSFSIYGRWKPLFPYLEVHLLDCFAELLGREEEGVRKAFMEQLKKRFEMKREREKEEENKGVLISIFFFLPFPSEISTTIKM